MKTLKLADSSMKAEITIFKILFTVKKIKEYDQHHPAMKFKHNKAHIHSKVQLKLCLTFTLIVA